MFPCSIVRLFNSSYLPAMPDSKNRNKKGLSVNKGVDPPGSVNPEYRKKAGKQLTVDEYVNGIRSGDRTVLSRAITLIESTKPENRNIGEKILEECLPYSGKSVRIGITGMPGVGKSTFIEALGKLLIDEGKKLAVLAVDPSSSRSRGSILGDKTRMPYLSSSKNTFIRSSPAAGTLGGVARKSRETMLVCEAAGFDTIFIETVGVGQSETTVHSMVDFFLLLMLAGAGDELQGIKRGIMEMADLIAINKADQTDKSTLNRAVRDFNNALSLFPPSPSGWKPSVLTCSAISGEGISELWSEINDYLNTTKNNGYFTRRREDQASHWMHETIYHELNTRFYGHPEIKKQIREVESKVKTGEISPFQAAEKLLGKFG
jgi:LAO/AO transport system kinase